MLLDVISDPFLDIFPSKKRDIPNNFLNDICKDKEQCFPGSVSLNINMYGSNVAGTP